MLTKTYKDFCYTHFQISLFYTGPFSCVFTLGMENRAGEIKGGGAIQKNKERKRRKRRKSNTKSRRENRLCKREQEDSAVLKKE